MKTITNHLAFRLLLFSVLPAILGPVFVRAQGSTPVTSVVAFKGEQIGAAGEDIRLGVAGPAAIDATGDVAALFALTGTSVKKGATAGIVLFSNSTATIVALSGSSNPITGGTFAKLSDPVLSGSGALAFIGALKAGGSINATNDTAIYVLQSGSLSLAASEGQTVTSGSLSGILSGFSQIAVNNAGGPAFLSKVRYTGGATTGLFATDQSGALQLLVAKGHGDDRLAPKFSAFVPLPFVSGQSRTLDTVNGNAAIVGMLDAPSIAIGLAVSGSTGFDEQILASTSGTIPNLPGVTVKALGEPAVNASATVAFSLALSGSGVNGTNNSAIGLVSASFQGVLVRTGSNAPDITGSSSGLVFKKLSDPVLNNNDAIAFIGTVKTGGTAGATGSNDTGIWSNWDGTLKLVVREGDPAPNATSGTTGSFSIFKQVVLPDVGGPIFLATLRGVPGKANTGVWALAPNGTLELIVKTGDPLDFNGTPKLVKSIGIFQLAPAALGQSRSFEASTADVVFQANFADGTWGIYRVTWQ
jgi:hypothetical protein